MSDAPLTVALFEECLAYRELLGGALAGQGLEVAVASGEVEPMSAALARAVPDVALLSTSPAGSTWAGRELLERHPEVRFLVLAGGGRAVETLGDCYRAGAAGLVFKSDTPLASLVESLRAVARGERLFPLEMIPQLLRTPSPGPRLAMELTERERDVLALVAAGCDNLKIAALLAITERTVKSHVAALYKKLRAENRVQLALTARQLGLDRRAAVERV